MTINDLRLRPDERGAIVGPTGCGKTVLAKQILPAKGALCIVDPKRLCKYDVDVRVYEDARKIARHKPYRFIYRPKVEDLNRLDLYNLVYRYCFERKNIFVYTDDVVGIMEKTKYPQMLQACYQMGRERNVAMLSSFQRPSWLPRFLLSEASKIYAFKLILPSDVKGIAEIMPGYDVAKLKERHTFLYYDLHRMDGSVPCKITIPK